MISCNLSVVLKIGTMSADYRNIWQNTYKEQSMNLLIQA
jgi:hypothetical protein